MKSGVPVQAGLGALSRCSNQQRPNGA